MKDSTTQPKAQTGSRCREMACLEPKTVPNKQDFKDVKHLSLQISTTWFRPQYYSTLN